MLKDIDISYTENATNCKYPLYHPGDRPMQFSEAYKSQGVKTKYILHDTVMDGDAMFTYVFGIFDSMDDVWKFVLDYNKKSDEMRVDAEMVELLARRNPEGLNFSEDARIHKKLVDAGLVPIGLADWHRFDIEEMREFIQHYVDEFNGKPCSIAAQEIN